MECERCIWWVHISDAPPGVMECCWRPRENEEIRPCEENDDCIRKGNKAAYGQPIRISETAVGEAE